MPTIATTDIEAERILQPSGYKPLAPTPVTSDLSSGKTAGLGWISAVLFGIGLALLYASDIKGAAKLWATDEMYQHGWFIFPISAGLVYWRRDEIANAVKKPEIWGLAILGLGLAMALAGYVLQIKYIGMWSIIPSIAGAVLALHGRNLWKIVGFAVCFLIFAGPLPGSQVATVSGWVQRVSTTGAAAVSSTLGFPLVQRGNYIDLPQGTLEVADVCSGFKKLTAMLAFGCLWAYLFPLTLWKRAVIVLCAIPIAVIANVIRISSLIAITSMGGVNALHIAHDPAEYAVLLMSFGFFMIVGKWLGCDRIRF